MNGVVVRGVVDRWIMSAHFVEEDCQLPFVEEDVVLGLVAYERAEVLAHHAVPVGPILLVEFFFYVLRDPVLDLDVVGAVLGLRNPAPTSLMASALMSEESAMSTMVSFFKSVIGCINITDNITYSLFLCYLLSPPLFHLVSSSLKRSFR